MDEVFFEDGFALTKVFFFVDAVVFFAAGAFAFDKPFEAVFLAELFGVALAVLGCAFTGADFFTAVFFAFFGAVLEVA